MKRVEVSKPGTNPFRISPRGTTMRSLVKALNLVVLAGGKERSATHGLRVAVQRSNALIGNVRRSPEADGARKTLQPFLVAIDLAQIVIRRKRGLLVTNALQTDALAMIKATATACIDKLTEAIMGEVSPSWPNVVITNKLDSIADCVSRQILSGLRGGSAGGTLSARNVVSP